MPKEESKKQLITRATQYGVDPLAPDQNISHIVKPRYQKHFLEYVSAKQYFIPDTQKLWVPLRGDAQKRLGQMKGMSFFSVDFGSPPL